MGGAQQENEIKLPLRKVEDGRRLLARAGARLVRERHFEDNQLFDRPPGELRAQGHVLRVRRSEPGPAVVTFKGPGRLQDGVRTREELEFEVGDAGLAAAVLERLGYRPCLRYQKYREVWTLDDVALMLDETPIGCFLELEGPPASVHRVATVLGFGRADYVTSSYPALYAAHGGHGDMVFP